MIFDLRYAEYQRVDPYEGTPTGFTYKVLQFKSTEDSEWQDVRTESAGDSKG